ncbi:MAG: low molecular weight phosphatase family protein [Pseudomonadota bacterium]
MAGPPSVIFVCGRNAVRSPMAEALWRAAFGADAPAISCGVEPASFPDGFMVSVMGELGHELSDYEPQDISAAQEDGAELIVSLAGEADAAARALAGDLGAAFAAWPERDPTRTRGGREEKLDSYRAVRDAIAARISQYRKTGSY